MKIGFDSAKDAANFAKHGISLREAERFDWETAIFWEDVRHDYGEIRIRALGFIKERLYAAVFTKRGEFIRMISLRKANARERKKYEKEAL